MSNLYPVLLRAFKTYRDEPLPVAIPHRDSVKAMVEALWDDGYRAVDYCERVGDSETFRVLTTYVRP